MTKKGVEKKMIGSEIAVIDGGSPVKNLLVSVHRSLLYSSRRVQKIVSELVPANEPDLEEVKGEIWRELSAVYYKYDDDHQKKAFRQVVQDISGRLGDGKWQSVYQKIHRFEQRRFSRISPWMNGRG